MAAAPRPTSIAHWGQTFAPGPGLSNGARDHLVLVHGAWHGGWCWERLLPQLLARGVAASTLTLSGLGARARELTEHTDLDRHVADVVAALRAQTAPVTLVGHSYAGLVVRQAADEAPDNVRRIVLIDGWAGPDGTSLMDAAPAWFADGIRALAATGGDGWRIPVPAPQAVGVEDPGDIAWLTPLLTEQPLATFTQPTSLSGRVELIPGRAILCRPAGIPFDELARSIGYETVSLDTGHDAMVTAPAALAAALCA